MKQTQAKESTFSTVVYGGFILMLLHLFAKFLWYPKMVVFACKNFYVFSQKFLLQDTLHSLTKEQWCRK